MAKRVQIRIKKTSNVMPSVLRASQRWTADGTTWKFKLHVEDFWKPRVL